MKKCYVTIKGKTFESEKYIDDLIKGKHGNVLETGFIKPGEYLRHKGKTYIASDIGMKESRLYNSLDKRVLNSEEFYDSLKQYEKAPSERDMFMRNTDKEMLIYEAQDSVVKNMITGQSLNNVTLKDGLYFKRNSGTAKLSVWEKSKEPVTAKHNTMEFMFEKIANIKNGRAVVTNEFKRLLEDKTDIETEYNFKGFDYQRMMPNVEMRWVTNETTKYPGEREYIENGIVHINKDTYSPKVPFHLMQHVYMGIVKSANPNLYERFMKWSEEQIENKTPIAQYVMKKYESHSGEDIKNEVIAKFAEMVSEFDYVYRTGDRREGIYDKMKGMIKEWYYTLLDFFRMKSGTYGHPLERLSETYHLDLKTASVEDIIIAMMKDASSGNFFTTITSQQLAAAYPHTMFMKSGKQVENIYELSTFLNPTGIERMTPEWYSSQNFINKTWKNYLSSTESEKLAYDQAFKRDKGRHMISINAARYINTIIGRSTQTGRLSEMSDFGLVPIHKKMVSGSEVNPELGVDPVIMVKQGKRNDKGILEKARVSLINFSTDGNLDRPGLELATKNLFHKHVATDEMNRIGNIFTDYFSGYSNFVLTLQALAVIKNNPTVYIDKLATIGMSYTKPDIKLFYFADGLKAINYLSTKPEIMDKLDPYMKSLFESAKTIKDKNFHSLFDVFTQITESRNLYDKNTFDLKLYQAISEYKQKDTWEHWVKLSELMRRRRDYVIRNEFNGDREQAMISDEVQIISDLLGTINIMKGKHINSQNMVGKSLYGNKIASMPDVYHPILNRIAHAIKTNTDRSIIRYTDTFEPQFEDLLIPVYKQWQSKGGNVVLDKVTETGSQAFRHLFKTANVKVKDGTGYKFEEAILPFIHWNKKDADTAKLIKEGKLTDADLALGKFIIDTVEENLLQIISVDRPYLTPEQVKEELGKKWDKESGHVPTMNKAVTEMMFEGNIKDAFTKYYHKNKDYNILNEEITMKDDMFGKREMQIPFWSQLGHIDAHLRDMGLVKNTDGSYSYNASDSAYTDGIKLNNRTSTNLEVIMKTFVVKSMHKVNWEKNIFPLVEDAEMLALLVQNTSGVDQQEAIRLIAQYTNRMAFGMGIDKTKESQMWPAARMLMNLMATSFITTNPKVWMAVTIGNIARTASVSLAAQTAEFLSTLKADPKSNYSREGITPEFPGAKEITQAHSIMISEWKKVVAMDRYYRLTERDEDQLVTNARNQYTKKTFHNRNSLNFVMRQTDIFNRRLVMVAKMIKDGTWDAHKFDKGKLTLDITKDGRYYKNGVITKEGKLLRDFYDKRMEQDGLKDNDQWTRLYSFDDMQKFQWLTDKFVLGTYSSKDRMLLDDHSFSKLFSQFRMFWVNVKTNKWSKPVEQNFGKDIIAKEEYIKEDGTIGIREYVKEEKYIIEGQVNTLIKYFKDVFQVMDPQASKAEQFASRFMIHKKIGDATNKLRKEQVYNLVQLGYEMLLYASLTAAVGAMWDYDEDDKEYEKSQVYRAVMGGIAQVLPYRPTDLYRIADSPMPFIDFIARIMKVAFMTENNVNKGDLYRVIPFYNSVNFVFDEETGLKAYYNDNLKNNF